MTGKISSFFNYDDIIDEIIKGGGNFDKAGLLAAVNAMLDRAVDAGILERPDAGWKARDIAALCDWGVQGIATLFDCAVDAGVLEGAIDEEIIISNDGKNKI